MIVFTVNEYENICIMGLNCQAGYANTRIKNLSFRPKFYGKTKVKWALIKSDHCFGFGKTMIWLNEYSLLFVLPQKFGPETKILDPCMDSVTRFGIFGDK